MIGQLVRYKTETNSDLVSRVFPRLTLVTTVYSDFSLAPAVINLFFGLAFEICFVGATFTLNAF